MGARKTFGDSVRWFRLRLDWSRCKLAKEAGLHDTHIIEQVEEGTRNISIDAMERICTALGTELRVMFGGIE